MKISQRGIDLIKSSEGLKLKAYLCPAGIWTIGYGFTKGVRAGMTITEEQATQRLMNEICTREKELNDILDKYHVVVNQNQFDALVSFQFNTGALGNSTLLKKLNKKDYSGAVVLAEGGAAPPRQLYSGAGGLKRVDCHRNTGRAFPGAH